MGRPKMLTIRYINPKSTGHFSPGTELGGGGVSTPSVKLDSDTIES